MEHCKKFYIVKSLSILGQSDTYFWNLCLIELHLSFYQLLK